MNLYARLQNIVNFYLFLKYENSVKSHDKNPIFKNLVFLQNSCYSLDIKYAHSNISRDNPQ